MKHSGFSLIEIMVALAISAMLSLILYRAFSQSGRIVQQIRDLMEEHEDTLTMYAQLEQDLTGMFVPVSEIKKATPQPTQQPPRQQEEPALFITTVQDSKVASCSWVTTNAFTVYDEATQRVVRVTYRFTEQTGEGSEQKLYTLMREESPYNQKAELEKKETQKAARSYALLHNISSWTMTFIVYETKQEKKEKVELSEWGTDAQKKKTPGIKIPEYVLLQYEITEPRTGRTVEQKMAFYIPAARCQSVKEPEKPPQQAQPQQQQNPQQQVPQRPMLFIMPPNQQQMRPA